MLRSASTNGTTATERSDERRMAADGNSYTYVEFMDWYSNHADPEYFWLHPFNPGEAGIASDSAGQPVTGSSHRTTEQWLQPLPPTTATATEHSHAPQALATATDHGQPPAIQVRLCPSNVVAVRQAEAARGPPRSLHNLARNALNAIANNHTYATVNLDDWFPWEPYIAAHAQSTEIIGPGITGAFGTFIPGTTDVNRGGMPRLDFLFYRTDGTVCRVHPGTKRKGDAKLIFESS